MAVRHLCEYHNGQVNVVKAAKIQSYNYSWNFWLSGYE